MDKAFEIYSMLNKIGLKNSDILDIKFNHMLDEINIYFLEKQEKFYWEIKLEMIGRVIYTTSAFDRVVYTGEVIRNELNKNIDNLENYINTQAYQQFDEIHVSEFDNRLLQIYFNFNALRMTITFKEISVRQCNPDELDLYMLNRGKS